MFRDKIIDEDDTKRFLIQTNPKPGRLYILHKKHKAGNPGRPIVSSNSHLSERISLKRSLSRRLVSPMYSLEQWLHCIM